MKTKSLVLGAHPPFDGPWVSLEGADKWNVVVRGEGETFVSIEYEPGDQWKEVCYLGETLEAVRLRAHLKESSNGDSISVSVFIESVEE